MFVGCTPPVEVEPTGAVLLVIERSGPRVTQDDALVNAMVGDASLGGVLIRAASCHNAVRWLGNASLNTSLVVSTQSRFVRVAELLANGEIGEDLARVAESSFWNGGNLEDDALSEGFGAAEIEAFAALVSQGPSPQALEQYVVYATSETTTRQAVVYLDSQTLAISSASSLVGPEPTLDPEIAGVGPYSFDTSGCSAFETAE